MYSYTRTHHGWPTSDLRWVRYLNRLEDNRLSKKILFSKLREGSRKIGWQKLGHKNNIERNMGVRNIPWNSWQPLSKIVKKLRQKTAERHHRIRCTPSSIGYIHVLITKIRVFLTSTLSGHWMQSRGTVIWHQTRLPNGHTNSSNEIITYCIPTFDCKLKAFVFWFNSRQVSCPFLIFLFVCLFVWAFFILKKSQ